MLRPRNTGQLCYDLMENYNWFQSNEGVQCFCWLWTKKKHDPHYEWNHGYYSSCCSNICHGFGSTWSCTRMRRQVATNVVLIRWHCLQCWCDLILFLLGRAPLNVTERAAVLTPLVLRPSSILNALVHVKLNYGVGRNICLPWQSNQGVCELSALTWVVYCLLLGSCQ